MAGRPTKAKKPSDKSDTIKKEETWQERFLKIYRVSGNVTLAANGANISRQHVYREMDASPEFKAEVDRARLEAIDILEATAFDRARKQSDVLLMFLLKGFKPEVYRENHVVTINDWRSRAIEDIRARRIDFRALAEQFDEDLATQLFKQAGVDVDAS